MSARSPRVLITGGMGFIGLAAAEALAERGAEILLFDPAPLPAAFARAPWLARVAERIEGDVRSGSDLARAFAHPLTHVLHAAALTPDAEQEKREPDRIVAVNVGGTVALMQAAAAACPAARLLVLSSVAVYGFADPGPAGDYDEVLSPPAPETLSGISKLAAEQAARRLAHLHDLDLAVARLGPVFGPWEHRSSARPALSPHHQVLEAAKAGRPCRLPRAMRADWLYARDAGAAIAALLLDRPPSPLFNIGAGTLSDVATWCRQVARRFPGFDWRILPEDADETEPPTIHYGLRRDRARLATVRLAAETGFRPRFDAAAAAADHLAWSAAYDPA